MLAREAKRSGVAIAIGHPHDVTLRLLAAWLARRSWRAAGAAGRGDAAENGARARSIACALSYWPFFAAVAKRTASSAAASRALALLTVS